MEAFSMTFQFVYEKWQSALGPSRLDRIGARAPWFSSFGLPGGLWWRRFFQAFSGAPPGRGPASHFGFALQISKRLGFPLGGLLASFSTFVFSFIFMIGGGGLAGAAAGGACPLSLFEVCKNMKEEDDV